MSRVKWLWIVLLCFIVTAFSIKPVLQGANNRLLQVWDVVNLNYVDTVDPDYLSIKASHALVSSLDPYSVFLDSAETIQKEASWRGIAYGGIGVNINWSDSNLLVLYADPLKAAYKAGIKAGDRIIRIDNQSCSQLGYDKSINTLRGNPGTQVSLLINRVDKEIPITVTREQITVETVPFYTVRDSIGYIKIAQFLEGTSSTLKKATTEIIQQGCKKLVIDLRDNAGGLVTEAVNCAGYFLPARTLVCTMKGRNPGNNSTWLTSDEGELFKNVKVLILINSATASASEIMAGALQDHKRAIIVGEESFGKGLVQGTRYTPSRETVYLSVARYYLPSGKGIGRSLNDKTQSRNGIKPDSSLTKNIKNNSTFANSIPLLAFNYAINNQRSFIDNAKIKDAEFTKFESYLVSNIDKIDFPFDAHLKEVKNVLVENKLEAELKKIELNHKQIKKKLIHQSRQALKSALEKELVRLHKFDKGVYEYNLKHDSELQAAFRIVKNI
jgi:carboxyl-terminal processing protease